MTTAILTILSCNSVFAGIWEQDSTGWRYKQDDGTYARNTQLWLDGDQDEIYQKFDFDEDGYRYMNVTGQDGQEYNEKGEHVYHGVVQTKKRSDKTYDNWLELMKQADSLLGQSYSTVQALYGQEQSRCVEEMFWKTAVYRFENSPLDYRFVFGDQTGPRECDLISTSDSFVPDGVTIRDLRDALGVDIMCVYSSYSLYGGPEQAGYSYSLNYNSHCWSFDVKNGAMSLDTPLKLTRFSIYPFMDDTPDGYVNDSEGTALSSHIENHILR